MSPLPRWMRFRKKSSSGDWYFEPHNQDLCGIDDPFPDGEYDEVEEFKYVNSKGYVRNRPLTEKSLRIKWLRRKIARRDY